MLSLKKEYISLHHRHQNPGWQTSSRSDEAATAFSAQRLHKKLHGNVLVIRASLLLNVILCDGEIVIT